MPIEPRTLTYETPTAGPRRTVRAVRKIILSTIPMLIGMALIGMAIGASVFSTSLWDPFELVALVLGLVPGTAMCLLAASSLIVAIHWLLGKPLPDTPWIRRGLRLTGEGRATNVTRNVEESVLDLGPDVDDASEPAARE